jgi:hypothetical protein
VTSKRRIAANRENAKKSTGPKTAEGKARVAQNAVVSRLLSRETLLPDEDPQALEMLAETTEAAWKPKGPQELVLVKMMVRALWRLGRVGRVEAGISAVADSPASRPAPPGRSATSKGSTRRHRRGSPPR